MGLVQVTIFEHLFEGSIQLSDARNHALQALANA